MNQFAKKIRSLRLQHKYTREQVASLIAMFNSDYVALEEGRTNPDNQLLQDFADLYKVKLQDLKLSIKADLKLIEIDLEDEE